MFNSCKLSCVTSLLFLLSLTIPSITTSSPFFISVLDPAFLQDFNPQPLQAPNIYGDENQVGSSPLEQSTDTNNKSQPALLSSQDYISSLRQNNFFGTWVSNQGSYLFDNYFTNSFGLMVMEALDADMTQGGNYLSLVPGPSNTTANFLSNSRQAGAYKEYMEGLVTWSLLVKIYDGGFVDQLSANLFYQVAPNNIVVNTTNATISINNGLIDVYLKDSSGDAVFYKRCASNFSLYYLNQANNMPYEGSFDDTGSMGIQYQVSSPDCNIDIISNMLTIDGFTDDDQINIYMLFASTLAVLQIIGAYKVRYHLTNKKNAFKLSVGTIWLMATVDYYMLILNLVIVFAYSVKFLVPLSLYLFLTFYIERDIILRLLQAQSKRNEIDISDESCRSCGFHFGLSTLLFVFELVFILMSKLWVIHLTALIFLPQIYFNAKRDKPYYFNFYNIFLMGLIRIIFIAYLKLYPENIFKLAPDSNFVTTYALIMISQVLVLFIQIKIPRLCFFFIGKRRKSRILDDDDVCPICMCDLKMEAKSADTTLLDLSETIQTPCAHVFHVQCIKKWVENKLECPVCREKIEDILEEMPSSSGDEGGNQFNRTPPVTPTISIMPMFL